VKRLIGEAGEHLVISRLHMLGYVASQAPRGWKAEDVFVREGPSFQVKSTNKGVKTGWMVGMIHPDDNLWYAFVDFQNTAPPNALPVYESTVYVMPSSVAHEATDAATQAVSALHPEWKDIGLRKIRDPWDKDLHPPGFDNGWLERYREAWDQLPPPETPRSD
jgi:hypothetical protein